MKFVDWRSVGGLVGRSDWGILCSILSLISTVMHWNWVPYFCASVFLVQVADISNFKRVFIQNILGGRAYLTFWHWQIITFVGYIDCGFASWINFRIGVLIFVKLINSKITRVWHRDKLRLRPRRHGEQTLTFLNAVHPTWEQTVNPSKCSTVPGLDKGIR